MTRGERWKPVYRDRTILDAESSFDLESIFLGDDDSTDDVAEGAS